MATLTQYRQQVQDLFNSYATLPNPDPNLVTVPLFDKEHDHYMVLTLGWSNGKRIHHCLLHLDIIDEQIWIQVNNTDQLVAEGLVAQGVKATDIVLGLQPPEIRQFTAYGVPHSTRGEQRLTPVKRGNSDPNGNSMGWEKSANGC
ncbi:XisI protein [Spirulina major]|uniref:XisI protein n=1 Tax=Spirulina major TaxID=270636 RepID=UPI000934290C|nr:XisI protein [Spirulina major]